CFGRWREIVLTILANIELASLWIDTSLFGLTFSHVVERLSKAHRCIVRTRTTLALTGDCFAIHLAAMMSVPDGTVCDFGNVCPLLRHHIDRVVVIFRDAMT